MHESNRAVNLLVTLAILGSASWVFAADVIPFFKPDPKPPVYYGPELPDPVATECGIWDTACLEAHDDRALDLALLLRDRTICGESTRPQACEDVVDMVLGDYRSPARQVRR